MPTEEEIKKKQEGMLEFCKHPPVEESVTKYGNANKHGNLEEVLPGEVWAIQGRFHMQIMGAVSKAGFTYIGRTMVIVKTADGLTLINPFHLTEEGYKAIEALGTVKNLVRLGTHGGDHPLVVQRFKGAEYWIVPGMQQAEGWEKLGVTTRVMSDDAMPIDGAKMFPVPELFVPEAVLVLPQGPGVLCTTDILQNNKDAYFGHTHVSYLMGFAMKQGGFVGKGRIGPAMLSSYKLYGKDGKQIISDWLREVLFNQTWDVLISGHGAPLLNAKAEVKATASEQLGTTF